MNEFEQARKRLADIDKVYDTKCDWNDPEDVACYKTDMRVTERTTLLHSLVPNKTCPGCGRVLHSLRSWVISRDKSKALCRSCFSFAVYQKKEGLDIAGGNKRYRITLFPDRDVRVTMDPFYLGQVREQLGLSRRQFAVACGWGHSYQRKLEAGQIRSLSLAAAETILQVIEEAGGSTEDEL